jgi:membrane protease YdiL (CAAX protease family)
MSITNPILNSPRSSINDSELIGKTNLFLLANLLIVIICGIILEQQLILGSIILESLMLLSTFLWIGLQGMDYRETLRLKLPSVKAIGVTLIAVGTGIYVASYVDQLFRYYLQKWGTDMEYNISMPQNSLQFLLNISAIVILPALAEEFLFRGYILKNYQKYLSTGKAVFISSLFFGIAHLNIYNFWGPFILGLICGWLVCSFDSIVLGVIGHLVNNGLTITFLYLAPNIWNQKIVSANSLIIGIPPFVIAGLIILILILKYKSNDKENKTNSGKLAVVFRHWSTWSLLVVFITITVIQFIMFKA